MTKKKALIFTLIAWGVISFLSATSNIADNQAHSLWMVQSFKDTSKLIMPSPQEDIWKGIQTGVGKATLIAFLLWLVLRSMVPIDERRSIGKAVIDEAVETVKDDLPLPQTIEDKARSGFWSRLNGIIGR